MSGQPIGIFAMKIEPGKVHRLALLEDLHLTSVSYDEELPLDAPNSRSSLRLHCFPANGAIKDGEEDDEEEEEEDEEEEDEDREEQTFVLASLSTKGSLHSSLSVDFARDEEIGFSITGNHPVDLVGSYIYASPEDEGGNSELDSDEYDLSPDSDEYDSEDMEGAEEAYAKLLEEGGLDSEDDDEEDEERFQELEDSEASKPKKKLVTAKAAADAVNGKKRSREDQDENGDVSMASSTNGVGASETDAELLAAGVKPSELEGLSRNQRKRLNKKLKGVDGEAAEPDVASEKPVKKEVKKVEIVEKKEPKKEAKKEVKKSSKVTLPSGTIIEDKKLAAGGASTRAAKAGDRVGMRYVGKLLKNGKEFDSNTKGKPFSFKLGRGEVIKGWDEGVKGMRVGDERRLTLPPQVAYGSQKIAGIPPNSTLVFDIKLVEIK